MSERWLRSCLVVAVFSLISANPTDSAEREVGTDRPGLNYRDFDVAAPLPDRCEAACNEDNRCRAWTFAWPGKKGLKAHCFLKSGLPPKKADNCCISGIKTKSAGPTEKQPETKTSVAPPSFPSPPTETSPEENLSEACQQYAQTAVRQNEQNEELFCGLSGSRWGYGYDVYFNWCMTKSSKASRASNTDARNRELQQCGAFIDKPKPETPPEPRDVVRETACREYANRAVEQSEKARELGCRQTGPRWSPAFQVHFSWCLGVGKSYQASEILKRDIALESCRPHRPTARAECEQYARAAFRLARQNRERRCGFTGPRWIRNVDDHKAWCLSATPAERDREQNSRHRALAACTGGPRTVSACARYAQGALKHAHDNEQRGCGFTGIRWQPDYEPHFIWCMNSTAPQRRIERTARIRSLLKCTRGTAIGEGDGLKLYSYRWRRVTRTINGWNSGWITTGSRRICAHKVQGCRCGWQNYCTTYRQGDVALWWRNGCERRPWKIVCEIRER